MHNFDKLNLVQTVYIVIYIFLVLRSNLYWNFEHSVVSPALHIYIGLNAY